MPNPVAVAMLISCHNYLCDTGTFGLSDKKSEDPLSGHPPDEDPHRVIGLPLYIYWSTDHSGMEVQ